MSDDARGERLDAFGERLDRVVRGPEAIEAQRLFRIARPLFALTGWRASMKADALTKLVALVSGEAGAAGDAVLTKALEEAVDELEGNVIAIERVSIVQKRAPIAHATWLRRVQGVLVLIRATLQASAAASGDAAALARAASRTDPSALLPPLVPRRRPGTTDMDLPHRSDAEASGDAEDDGGRLVDLELASIDHLMAAARAETIVLGRKRRLLIAARQRLLDASAALPLDAHGVRSRTRYLAREITRIDRLEAAGVATDVSLVHQARQALARREPARLFATLSALNANALAAGDLRISSQTGSALTRVCGGEAQADLARASLQRSAVELLGDAAGLVSNAVDTARSDAETRRGLGGAPSERRDAAEFLAYLPRDADQAILRAAVAADGFFEVGGALSPVRVAEEARVARVVRYPTQDLLLRPAEDVHDLKDALIGDPRSVLLDLATGRLFARRFVRDELHRRTRVVMHGEVRVYVLDGSGSMVGPRARVRDAILIAELSTLMRRLEAPGDTRCTLFYRYFDEVLGRVVRIGTVAEARDAIRDVVMNQRSGGTDIQAALLASLAQIAEARAHDPDLARAQVVLVTDGEAPVDEPAIVAARDALRGLPVGVSVIALGEENAALRGLVARQRAKGEAAFYHFLDDAELAAITGGEGDAAMSIHPPERWTTLGQSPAKLAEALDDEVGGLLEELEGIDRARDVAALEQLDAETQARREVGLSDVEVDGGGDGERARVEALRRDRVALAARYARWFPEPLSGSGASKTPTELPPVGTEARDDIEAASCALASVAEVVALLGGTPLARQADAIDLFERLLPDARLSPARYRAVLREFPDAVEPALRALRAAVTGRVA